MSMTLSRLQAHWPAGLSPQDADLRDLLVAQVLPALVQRADDLDVVSPASFNARAARQAFDLAEAVLQERARRSRAHLQPVRDERLEEEDTL